MVVVEAAVVAVEGTTGEEEIVAVEAEVAEEDVIGKILNFATTIFVIISIYLSMKSIFHYPSIFIYRTCHLFDFKTNLILKISLQFLIIIIKNHLKTINVKLALVFH